MRLKKFFIFIIALTIIAVIYIHMQMQIIELAYDGKQKQKKIIHLVEQKEDLISKILTLKWRE